MELLCSVCLQGLGGRKAPNDTTGGETPPREPTEQQNRGRGQVPAGKKKHEENPRNNTKKADTQSGRGAKGEGEPAASKVHSVKRAARRGMHGLRDVGEGVQEQK